MESESPFIYSQLGERVCVCPTTHEKQTVTCRSRAKARTVGPNRATPRTPTMAKQWRSSDKPSASRRYQVALAGCRRPSRFSSSHHTGYFALLFATTTLERPALERLVLRAFLQVQLPSADGHTTPRPNANPAESVSENSTRRTTRDTVYAGTACASHPTAVAPDRCSMLQGSLVTPACGGRLGHCSLVRRVRGRRALLEGFPGEGGLVRARVGGRGCHLHPSTLNGRAA